MLSVESLTHRYADLTALGEVSFDLPAGRVCGFLGPNGAGKTTAMRAIMGLVRPTEGRVRWRSQSVDAAVRRRFGYMPEERGLYPKMTVRDHVVYLARAHQQRPAAARTLADEWIERMGLSERAGDRVEQLSLGNQQRVQLAAALVHEPELLVLDEPFSGLDPIGVTTMSAVLHERAAAGTAVLFSSHQLDLVEDLCESVVVLDRGRVVLQGAVDALKRSDPPRYRVETDADTASALRGLPGVQLLPPASGSCVTVEVRSEDEEQAVLDAAQRAGRLRHFSRALPSLSQLFADAVARPDQDTSRNVAAGDADLSPRPTGFVGSRR
jgi:ABC-2 type transport system ATP-binding protein